MQQLNGVRVCCVVPNWNGEGTVGACLDSLLAQSHDVDVIVVDNGSTDGSVELVERTYPTVELVRHSTNLGFAGGVNSGIRVAMQRGARLIALLNNDATADRNWLAELVTHMVADDSCGIATCKLMTSDGQRLDSTGEMYSTWGFPFPRGRFDDDCEKYDRSTAVFGASGGASLYRATMLREVGLFDEDFFAYFEDVDLSFRAQLAGWTVAYVPSAVAYHHIATTSDKLEGFFTYQQMKNLPWLLVKDVPAPMLRVTLPRFVIMYLYLLAIAARRGELGAALRGMSAAILRLHRKLDERRRIQANRKVTVNYIQSILTWDLPANTRSLHRVRDRWWRLTGGRSLPVG